MATQRFVGVRTVNGIPTCTTYGYARNARGQIEQVYATVQKQCTVSQEWTASSIGATARRPATPSA